MQQITRLTAWVDHRSVPFDADRYGQVVAVTEVGLIMFGGGSRSDPDLGATPLADGVIYRTSWTSDG